MFNIDINTDPEKHVLSFLLKCVSVQLYRAPFRLPRDSLQNPVNVLLSLTTGNIYGSISLFIVKSLSRVQPFVTPWTVYSPPGSSVHGILQARILEWVAISVSRGSSQPRDRTQVSHIAGRRFNL